MSGPVDVLAVLAGLADQNDAGDRMTSARELREVRAAIAGLMEAAGKAQDTNRDDYVLGRPDVSHMAPELRAYFLAGWDAASEAVYQTGLRAALARTGGAK